MQPPGDGRGKAEGVKLSLPPENQRPRNGKGQRQGGLEVGGTLQLL